MEYRVSHIFSSPEKVHPYFEGCQLFDPPEMNIISIVFLRRGPNKVEVFDGPDDCLEVVDETDLCHPAEVL